MAPTASAAAIASEASDRLDFLESLIIWTSSRSCDWCNATFLLVSTISPIGHHAAVHLSVKQPKSVIVCVMPWVQRAIDPTNQTMVVRFLGL
jgi:hypothetical protein